LYHGISFFVFTSVKQWVKEHNPDNFKKWYIDFLCGGLSACGQVFGYPIDIIRKRMQAQSLLLQKNKITKIVNYRELITSIWNHEGFIKGFYKGISLNAIKGPLALATSWTIKNKVNRLLDSNYDL
jgi:solute carrier family 25 protein 42